MAKIIQKGELCIYLFRVLPGREERYVKIEFIGFNGENRNKLKVFYLTP